jgi:hypothetical protein
MTAVTLLMVQLDQVRSHDSNGAAGFRWLPGMVCLVTDGTPFYCPRLPTASDGFPRSNTSADGHPYLNRFPRSNTGADGHPYLNGFPRSTTGTDGHPYLFEHGFLQSTTGTRI